MVSFLGLLFKTEDMFTNEPYEVSFALVSETLVVKLVAFVQPIPKINVCHIKQLYACDKNLHLVVENIFIRKAQDKKGKWLDFVSGEITDISNAIGHAIDERNKCFLN